MGHGTNTQQRSSAAANILLIQYGVVAECKGCHWMLTPGGSVPLLLVWWQCGVISVMAAHTELGYPQHTNTGAPQTLADDGHVSDV